MLLELRQLSESLKAANVAVGERDDHLVGYSKAKPLFRVELNETGKVQAVRPVSREVAARMVKYEVSKGGARESIPGFNVPPLLVPTGAPDERSATEKAITQFAKLLRKPQRGESQKSRTAALDQLVGSCESGWDAKADAIEKCLGNAADVLMRALAAAEGADRAAVAPLLDLLGRAKLLSPTALREQLLDVARVAVTGEAGSEEFLQLLFTKDSIVLLELADTDGTPANHDTVWQAVNRVLLAGRKGTLASGVAEVEGDTLSDAFGEVYVPSTEKMPERKLPRLGNVKLRSNSATKPCQTRYGWVEGQSFPVALPGRASYANAIAWLTDEEREGHTYRDLSNACGFELPALLLAYPDPLPATRAPALAAVLAKTNQTGPLSADVRFTSAAEVLIKQLDDLKVQERNASVTIFVLAKRDTARTKLLFHRQFSANRITDAIRAWVLAAANHPPVSVRQFGEDKKPRWVRCDDTPYPDAVPRLLNTTWIWDRNELKPKKVSGFDFGSALTLLLDKDRTEVAAEGLRLAVTQWSDLLLAMGQAAKLGQVCTFSPNEQLLLPQILGLLLFKLGHRKEVYMQAMPYWLGRLLAIADRLHRNYCELERERQFPPQLIGNAAMAACLDNPQAGLARLAERLPLYQRVAGIDLGREVAEIVRHIDADNLPKRATDEHKAQMILGYLARPDLLPAEPVTPSEAQS